VAPGPSPLSDRLGRLLLVMLEAARVDAALPVLGAKCWRATFYTTGIEHSITSATACASERTPWHAVQGVARNALRAIFASSEMDQPRVFDIRGCPILVTA